MSDPRDRPAGKTNSTPDLDDEQYMEQLYLIAQAIAVMPGVRDGMPNATTPPPIRPRWAKFLVSQGMRIDPKLATHRLVSQAPAAAGAFGPQQLQAVKKIRTTMNREDLFRIWHDMNPETYERVMNGVMTRDELWNLIPAEVKAAAEQAEQLRDQGGGDGGSA